MSCGTPWRPRDQGRRPYIIPGGGSNRIGALGYVGCALELVAQANERRIDFDHIDRFMHLWVKLLADGRYRGHSDAHQRLFKASRCPLNSANQIIE